MARLRRFGVIGDVHAEHESLEVAVLVVRGNHDRWLLRSEMRKLSDATDAASLSSESLAWLSSLPATRTLSTLEGPLVLCHAVGEDDMKRLAGDDYGYALESNDALTRVITSGARVMVCGHTHQTYLRRLGELLIINAGTLHREGNPGFLEIDLEVRVARRYAIDARATVTQTSRVTLP